jgi:hypothetical protein
VRDYFKSRSQRVALRCFDVRATFPASHLNADRAMAQECRDRDIAITPTGKSGAVRSWTRSRATSRSGVMPLNMWRVKAYSVLIEANRALYALVVAALFARNRFPYFRTPL